jgi:mannan endo-1,4-beta-mannosidase
VKHPILAAIAMPAAAALLAVALVALVNPGVLRHPRSVLTPASATPAGASPASASPADRTAGRCQRDRVTAPFVGVAINPPITKSADSFASATGVRPGVVEFYTAFRRPFPRFEAAQAAARGSLPLVQVNFRGVSLASVAAGRYDIYLRQYARTVKTFGCRLALSLGHEMNGSWYSWGLPDTSPATFIAAWRHIHRIFSAEQVRNVIWSWDPDHVWQPAHGGSWARLWWPGSPYVDWIGLDGYQRPGESFDSVFGRQLANIRSFTSKRVFIAETGVAPGATQASQISGLFSAVSREHLAGLVWFDIDRKENWRLQGDPAGLLAFRKAAGRLDK